MATIANNTIQVKDLINFPNSVSGTFLGYQAGGNANTGINNTFVGYQSGLVNTSGYWNTAIGMYSLFKNNTGYYNTAVGLGVLGSNTTGWSNTAVGNSALGNNTGGYYNTAVGLNALLFNTVGRDNTANGWYSLYSNNTGIDNTANGVYSLQSNTTGSGNTANGYGALRSNVTGSNNVALGYHAGRYEIGSNSFYIDNQDRTNTAGDNTKALLYGTFAAATSSQQLTVNGALNVSGALTVGGSPVGGGGGASYWTQSGSYLYAASTTWNVGIKQTAPVHELTIGDGSKGHALSFGDYTILGSAYSSGAALLGNMVQPISGNAGYEKSTSITIAQAAIEINAGVINFATKTSDANAKGTVWDMAANTKMTILNNGNVGIGTTAPTNKLHINQNSASLTDSGILIADANSGEGNRLYIGSNTDGAYYRTDYSSGGNLSHRFYTYNTEIMRIDGSGNVGIGTTAPAAKLAVGGTGSAGDTIAAYANSANSALYAEQNGTGYAGYFKGKIALDSQSGNYDALGTISTNEFAIQPYTYFHVLKGYAYTSSGRKFNAGDYMMTINNNDINFSPTGNSYFSTGNVGIGTTVPGAALDVQGQIIGGFGAVSTGGVLDWNDPSNIRPGSGYTLLMGNAANGPGPVSYFHAFNLEYSSKDGSGSITQLAIPYASPSDAGIWIRGRYSGSWSSWSQVGGSASAVAATGGVGTHNSATVETQTIAHGLGKTPKLVKITAFTDCGSTGYGIQSVGSTDGTNHRSTYLRHTSASVSANSAVYDVRLQSGSDSAYGIVTFDATNIYIAWTKANLGIGTVNFLWDAE